MTPIQFKYTKTPKYMYSERNLSQSHVFTNADVENKWLMKKEETFVKYCGANHSYRIEEFRDFL
jgi:hypothetical protein